MCQLSFGEKFEKIEAELTELQPFSRMKRNLQLKSTTTLATSRRLVKMPIRSCTAEIDQLAVDHSHYTKFFEIRGKNMSGMFLVSRAGTSSMASKLSCIELSRGRGSSCGHNLLKLNDIDSVLCRNSLNHRNAPKIDEWSILHVSTTASFSASKSICDLTDNSMTRESHVLAEVFIARIGNTLRPGGKEEATASCNSNGNGKC